MPDFSGGGAGLRRQGGQGVCLTPLVALPDPLRESLYEISVGNCYINRNLSNPAFNTKKIGRV